MQCRPHSQSLFSFIFKFAAVVAGEFSPFVPNPNTTANPKAAKYLFITATFRRYTRWPSDKSIVLGGVSELQVSARTSVPENGGGGINIFRGSAYRLLSQQHFRECTSWTSTQHIFLQSRPSRYVTLRCRNIHRLAQSSSSPSLPFFSSLHRGKLDLTRRHRGRVGATWFPVFSIRIFGGIGWRLQRLT